MTVNFEPVEEDICNTVFCIVGKNTTYSGKIYLDNIKMLGKETSSEDKKEDGSVDSTIEVKDGNPVAVSGMTFKSGKGLASNLPSKVEMVDKAATAQAKGVYAYLAAVGNTDSFIYGHQDDTWQKAGSSSLTESDTKDVTGSEAESVEDYALRYPGDEYVDMVGFDMYDSDPKTDEDGYDCISNFTRELEIVQAFATSHNKLLAITETGLASSSPDKGHNQTVLHKTGNNQPDWYNKMLNAVADSKASYMLLWANFGKRDGYYTPYVDSVNEDGSLHGHEMLDNFISFYNDERTIFANDQKDALESIDGTKVSTEAVSDVYGFILTPVAGVRVLNEISLQGSVFGEADKVSFKLDGDDKSLNIKAKLTGNRAGAIISKEVDWSDCDTLSFYVIPDGKNQKTVVQLTANGNVYETYLNLYEEYSNAKAGTPLKVNIPFSDFCQRDTAGNPKGGLVEDSKAITSFGLWVNAIEDSEAVENGYVSGTLIYDKITAVETGIDKATFEILKGFNDKADDKSEESAEKVNTAQVAQPVQPVQQAQAPQAAEEAVASDAGSPILPVVVVILIAIVAAAGLYTVRKYMK